MNTSFSSLMWKNQSLNQSMHNQSGSMLATTYSIRQRNDYIMSTNTHFTLEPFGAPLPSMVKALLNQAVDGQKISSRVDPNGWAWLVSGRRLYIWRHSFGSESKRSNIIACRELWLPTSELDHQAQLVCIVANSSSFSCSSAPACIAVSPEGQITYWPNVSNDSGTITISADVPGQECESLSSLWPHACILTTTTSTVMLIKPCLAGGNKPSLSCVPLILNKGWFGGIGRRVSSMLFNPIPSSALNETKKTKVVVPISKDDPSLPGAKNPFFFILHGSQVQTWSLGFDQQLNQNNAVNLEDNVRRLFYDSVWNAITASERKPEQLRRIQTCFLDIDVLPNQRVAVLTAAYDPTDSSPMIHYGIFTFDAKEGGREHFIKVNYTGPEIPTDDDQRTSELHTWRLLTVSNFYCMVNVDQLVLITEKPDDPADIIDANSSGGPFLGFGRISDGIVTVFAPKYGIMSLKTNVSDNLLDSSYTDRIKVPDNLAADITQYNFDDVVMSDDNVNRLKTAFLAFITKKSNECQEIISTLFPANKSEWSPYDSIDITALALCEKLIDDAPATDQRGGAFASSADPDHMGYRSKQLIYKCLNSKKEVVELYLGFLNNVGLMQQLTRVVVKEDTVATASLLYNDYEKIGFALAIQQLQSEPHYRDLLEAAIKLIVKSRSEREAQVRSSHLGVNEQFYKDVSKIHQIIKGLVMIEEEQLNQAQPKDMPDIVGRVNEIILKSLNDMSTIHLADKIAKVKNSLVTPLLESTSNEYEIQNWIVDGRMLPHLLKQHHLIVLNGLNVTEDGGIRAKLSKELHEFTDLILNGLKKNLDSLRNSDRYNQRLKKFEEVRYALLKEFLEIKDYDRALGMAEKYLDFGIIVRSCVEREDYEMLEHYFQKYDSLNFPVFTFEWFVKQKKQHELVTMFTNSIAKHKLALFLEGYPEMLWHFQTIIGETRQAACTLKLLANSEETDPEDRLLFLQLSKLGLLASGVSPDEVDAMREYDETNFKEDVDLDKLSNMSINEMENGILPSV
ncbi:unnamed protein product [Allacma fusca]|uniref:Nuclear pore complex protein Nup133 n=1 Tax=Allacma fusca TaxID=39272 RepID=A0A8J2JR71_9HEXA|nr:unnamed protein product [Allacma fusca]